MQSRLAREAQDPNARTPSTRSVPPALAEYVHTRSKRAYERLWLAEYARLVAYARGFASEAVAEDAVSDVFANLATITEADLGTPRGNLTSLVRWAVLAEKKPGRKQIHGIDESADDEPTKLRSRRVEREAWTRSGAMTPERAVMFAELGATGDEMPALYGSAWAETRLEVGLEPMAIRVLNAMVALCGAGVAPTAPRIAERIHGTSTYAAADKATRQAWARDVRRYFTDLRRGGWIDEDRTTVRTLDGARIALVNTPSRPRGLTEATVRMFSAYVDLVRETGRRPTQAAVVARVERDTGRRYGDVKRPFAAMRAEGLIDAETGAVLRTLDGSPVPAFAAEPETTPEVSSDIVATIESTADLERESAEDAARRSLLTEDRVPVAVVPHLFSPPSLVDRARWWAETSAPEVVLALAAPRATEHRIGAEGRPRLALRVEGADPGGASAAPRRSLSPVPMPVVLPPEDTERGYDWDGWESVRIQAEVERTLSINRDAEDLDDPEVQFEARSLVRGLDFGEPEDFGEPALFRQRFRAPRAGPPKKRKRRAKKTTTGAEG